MKKVFLPILFLIVLSLSVFVYAVECEDSDGGQNLEVKGTSTGIYAGATEGYHVIIGQEPDPNLPKTSPYNYSIIYDYCFDNYQVSEAWCSNGVIQLARFSCDSESEIEDGVCSDGACVPNSLATDRQCSEFGYNKQYGVINYCDDSHNSYDLSVCYNVSYSCSDSDGGKDYYMLGQLSVKSTSNPGPSCYGGGGSGGGGAGSPITDSCGNDDVLRERICNADGTAGFVEYTCPNGCSNGVCLEEQTPATTYFKSCSYVWDSLPYVNQTIKITASIKDSTGKTDSDSVQVKVVEGNIGSGGGGYSMDGKTLDIQINEPRSETVKAGAVEIKISSKGPNELGEMTLGFLGENWGAGFPISDRNCAAGGSGGGGSSTSIPSSAPSTCERYHTCQDGTEVQYCEIIKQYDSSGNVGGSGCACKRNPEELCAPPSSGASGGGGSVEPIEVPSSGGGGGGGAETPIICNGCIVGDKCVPIGYRSGNKYCNIESELVEQYKEEVSCNNSYECASNICEKNQCGKYCDGCKDENANCIPFGTRLENSKYCNIDKSIKDQKSKESSCSNNYECVSNVCVNSKCVEPSLLEKIISWFKKLFGG